MNKKFLLVISILCILFFSWIVVLHFPKIIEGHGSHRGARSSHIYNRDNGHGGVGYSTDRANPIWQDGYSDFVIFPDSWYSYRVVEWWPMWYL
jgi:hypothetical protein